MEVGITDLRAHLKRWLALAQAGEDVVVTDRGTPVVRLIGVESGSLLDRLADDGVITRASASRPQARGRHRAQPTGSVSKLVSEQRD